MVLIASFIVQPTQGDVRHARNMLMLMLMLATAVARM